MLEKVPIDIIKLAVDKWGVAEALNAEYVETPLPTENAWKPDKQMLEVHHLHPMKNMFEAGTEELSYMTSASLGRVALQRFKHSHYLDACIGKCECGAVMWGVTTRRDI